MDQFDHDMHQALTEIQAEANADISETAQSVSEQTNAQTHHSAHSKESVISSLNELAQGDGSNISRDRTSEADIFQSAKSRT